LKRLVTFLVLLCSISPVVPRKDPHAPPGFIEPELQAYVDAFYADCAKACAPFKDSMLSVQGVRGQMVYNGTSVTGLALVSFSLYGIRRVVYVRMDDRGPYTVKATVYLCFPCSPRLPRDPGMESSRRVGRGGRGLLSQQLE
jgi:hypothetical protein